MTALADAGVRSLAEPLAPRDFGGKAATLARAVAQGLPVPAGYALSVDAVERAVRDAAGAADLAAWLLGALRGPVAVRSSAVGEDGAAASFAGQHATVLNVRTVPGLVAALRRVHDSATGEGAMAYRRRMGIGGAPRIGIVVQALVPAERAGVLFTRDPLSGADERVVEAAWGLGEAVVAGLVTPDHYRMERGGRLLERTIHEKDVAIVLSDVAEGTEEVELDEERATEPCLDTEDLLALDALATRIEAAFGAGQDLEWAFVGRALSLLQWRPVTA